ncbi:PREDICTED: palmitoyltransferase AKR1-like isoform X2 [Amphimedon queenslandica]|uniref:Palmitoyltransferase n=1 Tax=Amphimedon queenslandica TaxID=400682 RepID=A0AAN0J4A6_AMPQE|nr:PREDICTED: palmitoyltransferase AKR1-like isoform X2 [Amphimedon queenslandica]|eukprot:XP_019851548.1 PREDICTED: palmitoyltransferase AKR1-like isoform X2 [Amphimedon queenslandica]
MEEQDMSGGNHAFFQLLGSVNNTNIDLVDNTLLQDLSLLSVPNQNGLLPIQVAANRGYSPLIQLLAKHGADIEVTTKDGKTPVMLACQSGSLYAVHAFNQCGSNMISRDSYGRTLMHYAATVGAVHTMHYLHVNCNLAYDAKDNDDYTPLHLAVWNSHMQCVTYLLKNGRCGDVNAANVYGTTPLAVAAKNGSRSIARHLILSSKKNLLLSKDGNGMTPVQHALHGGTDKFKEFALQMSLWTTEQLTAGRSLMPSYDTLTWYFVFFLPGSALTLAAVLFTLIPYLSVSIPLALAIVIFGFFAPLNNHRLPTDSGLQNPAPMGAFLAGLTITVICYFTLVWPRLWPDNWYWFIIIAFDYIGIIYLFWKLEYTDPGFEYVGKRSEDGRPLTIVDVAGQERGSGIQYSFCTECEIVIPEMAKHCKLCSRCCNNFDHHCLWLKMCIGANNHHTFVIFLFLLSLDNFLFVRGGCSILALLSGTYDPWVFLKYAMVHEKFLIFLMLCNFLTGLFGMMNLLYQLSIISAKETTYFDSKGLAAFGRKRDRQKLSVVTRLRNIKTFFFNGRHKKQEFSSNTFMV